MQRAAAPLYNTHGGRTVQQRRCGGGGGAMKRTCAALRLASMRTARVAASAAGDANGAANGAAAQVDVTVEPHTPDEQQQQPVTVVVTNKPQTLASHPLSALAEADPFGADELVEELLRPADGAPPLGRRGEALLLAQVVAVAFVVFPPFRLAGLFDLLATLALVAGIVFCIAGLVSLGRSFSPLAAPRKRHSLVTGGLYAHVRHPLYGGLLMAAVGLAAVTHSEGRLACAALLWLVVERKAAFEEAALAARYGADWTAYAAQTKFKFVPWMV